MEFRELKSFCYPDNKRITNDYLFLTFFLRKISIYFTYILIKLKVTANQVSLLSIISTLFGCYLLSTGDHRPLFLGAISVNAGMLSDCIDGEIARYRGVTKLGGFLERIYSDLTYALLLPAIAVGLYRTSDVKNIAIIVLAFCGAISGILFRSYLDGLSRKARHSPTIFERNRSKAEKIILEQLQDRQEEASGLGRFLFIFWMNIYSRMGVLLPLVVLAVFLDKLEIYVRVYSIAYIALYLGTLFLALIILSVKRMDLLGEETDG